MKKGNNKSNSKISGASDIYLEECQEGLPHDVLVVEVFSVQVPEEETLPFFIKVSFFDEKILSGVVNSSWARDVVANKIIAKGTMNYDPSDYERMSLFADAPLIVSIKPANVSRINTSTINTNNSNISQETTVTDESQMSMNINGFSCNIDILPMFLDTDDIFVKIRMQPVLTSSVLNAISWDNLPLLTIKLSVDRNPKNEKHHDLLAKANYFKVTLIGCFNLSSTLMDLGLFTAATKTAMHNETNNAIIEFDEGIKSPKRFLPTNFYPKWERIRLHRNVIAQHSEKLQCSLESIRSDENVDLKKCINRSSTCGIEWGSFHRTLMFKETEMWLFKFVREFKWPFQLRISAEVDYSLMAFLDLFRLLYPGEDTVRLAVPLQWLDEAAMKEKCDCETMLELNEWEPSQSSNNRRLSKMSEAMSKTNSIYQMPTGNDNTSAFVIVEVVLRNPIKKIMIPLHISTPEINKMLDDMKSQPCERECTARGQLARDWTSTVKMASNALRRISYYGSTDFCIFDRRFSSTRTRVEMVTSFCDEAAIYVNNNFVTRDFLESENTFKELVLMAHACLVREAAKELLPIENLKKLDPVIRAARHARHFQDTYHAVELYFQSVTQNPRDAKRWRELAACLQDLDQDWADVCLDRSILLNPRHPLTLLAKGCMIFKRDPDEAEPFFLALLFFQPFWVTGMVAANAYFIEREHFDMADAIVACIKNIQAQGLSQQVKVARGWEHELGDWWDSTPLLPGMSLYYDTADLLLRIRGIKLAEVCLAQAVRKTGECSAYFHLLALCCRLNGDTENALCYIEEGIKKYGEISYLRTLQAECYNVQRNRSASILSLEKTDTSTFGSFSILLTILSISSERSRALLADLLRRQPSAYAWIAFAEEWILASQDEGKEMSLSKQESQAISYAIACATEALKIDKQSGRAWALLSRLVKSRPRKIYCAKMANVYGHNLLHERIGSPRQSLCQRLGKALRECQCKMCNHFIL